MALKLPSLHDTFKVVLRIDSAVQADSEGYERYLETLDEGHLKLAEEPTRFVMRKVLPNRLYKKVQDDQFQFKGKEAVLSFSFTSQDVRCSLIGIENPPHLPLEDRIEFKADSDGGACENLIAQLQAAGVIMDLYRAKQTAVGAKDQSDTVKKK